MLSKKQISETLDVMAEMFPDAHCELNHSNHLELVIAVVLSAQCTDALVNRVTPKLFETYPALNDYLEAPLEDVEVAIRQIGLYRNKAKFIKQLTEMIHQDFGGEVPNLMEDLIKLPGVGRKTANVVMSVAFGKPAIAVDTHVERVSKRLGFCKVDASVLEVEKSLMRKIPETDWSTTHHLLIFFGRYHCKAQNPQCESCQLQNVCRDYKKRNKVKRK